MIKQIFLSDSTDQLDMKQLIFAEINGVSVNGKMISDALDDNALSLVENAKTYVPKNSNDGFKDYLLDNARYILAVSYIIRGEIKDIERAEITAKRKVKELLKQL